MMRIRKSQRAAFSTDPKRTVAVAPPPVPAPVVPLAPPIAAADPGSVPPLRLRKEQMPPFEQAALKTFEDEMVVHSQEFSPRLCEVLGEVQLRVALRQALARGGGCGFTYRGPLRLFIEMVFLFGSAFDTDPQYPWAGKILHTSDDQMDRAEQLCSAVLEYQGKVGGPGGSNTRRALRELRELARKPTEYPAAGLAIGLRRDMRLVFPQKVAYVGDEGLTALIHAGSAKAREHRFPATQGDALLATLMFAFGHGCLDDPLYPWIARTLRDAHMTDGTARMRRLEKKAVTWLEHVLGSPSEGAPA